MKIKKTPIMVQSSAPATEAWLYENKKSIDVFIYTSAPGPSNCRIPRRVLADWIKRTKP